MFGFIRKVLVVTMTFFGCNVLNVNPLKCVSMNNKECKTRPQIININNNEPLFYPYSVKRKINAAVVVIISTTPIQNSVLSMLLRT